ncbi:MAG TPA: hypothetical protein VI279_14710 [Rhodocyclaceae bacterium]
MSFWAIPSFALPEPPALMVLSGSLAGGSDAPGVTPMVGDAILAFSVTDGRLVGQGVVGRSSYQAIVTRTASFNGSLVVLELQQGKRRYSLLQPSGAIAAIRFQGKTLPDRTPLDLVLGRKTAELSDVEQANPGAQRLSQRTDLPCDDTTDANGDGVCDAADFRILRLYGGGISRTIATP